MYTLAFHYLLSETVSSCIKCLTKCLKGCESLPPLDQLLGRWAEDPSKGSYCGGLLESQRPVWAWLMMPSSGDFTQRCIPRRTECGFHQITAVLLPITKIPEPC